MTTELQSRTSGVSRAVFLASGGAVIVSFGLPPAASAADAAAKNPGPYGYRDPAQLDTWIAVSQSGTVTFYTGRIDFGQRKATAFTQIVAEELDVAYEAVKHVMGDTALTPNQGGSLASDGIQSGAKPLRHAAAEARRVLLDRAARQLGVDASTLTVNNGVVSVVGNPSRRVPYGDLVGAQRFDVTLKVSSPDSVNCDVVGAAKLKDPQRYSLVGKSIPAQDVPGKVRGTWPRVHNIRLAGMLHARLILPPGPGAHLVRVGDLPKRIPGFVKVVTRGDVVAVVAKTEWSAIQAARLLPVEWTPAATLPGNAEIFAYLRTGKAARPQKVVTTNGDAQAAIASAAHVFKASYNYPIQNHGIIGPSCGVADYRDGQVLLYAGTQDPPATREASAKLLGVPRESVRVIPVEPSGCYGRQGLDDATVAAALISQDLRRPVRVQLMRDQEQAWAPMPPPWTFDVTAGVDASGKIVGWTQHEWSWGMSEVELPVMLAPKAEVTSTGTIPPFFRAPGGGGKPLNNYGTSSSVDRPPGYQFANVHVLGDSVAPLLRGTWMRSPGRLENNFAGEVFMDEIAAGTKQDPIAFRLRHVDDERSQTILRRVAALSHWETRASPGPDARSSGRIAHGRGVAVVLDQNGTFIATVAQVEVDRRTGIVSVKHMFVVADAGVVINPDGIRAQIEGASIFATSRALKEETTYDRSKVTSVDWMSYPILRFTEVPELKIDVVNRVEVPPSGIGEPPNTTPAAAIGNAIFDAIGIRLRELPYTPRRVKEALTQV